MDADVSGRLVQSLKLNKTVPDNGDFKPSTRTCAVTDADTVSENGEVGKDQISSKTYVAFNKNLMQQSTIDNHSIFLHVREVRCKFSSKMACNLG